MFSTTSRLLSHATPAAAVVHTLPLDPPLVMDTKHIECDTTLSKSEVVK